MLKEKAPCKFLSIIMMDSVIKANKKYTRKNKIENYINEDLENSESDSNSNNEIEQFVDSVC